MRRLLLGTVLATVACAGGVTELGPNEPDIGWHSTQGFTFSVQARGFEWDKGYTVNLAARTLIVQLAVDPYVAGTGRVDIMDYAGTVIWTRPLEGTAADVVRKSGGPGPYSVRVTAHGLTGFMALAVRPGPS